MWTCLGEASLGICAVGGWGRGAGVVCLIGRGGRAARRRVSALLPALLICFLLLRGRSWPNRLADALIVLQSSLLSVRARCRLPHVGCGLWCVRAPGGSRRRGALGDCRKQSGHPSLADTVVPGALGSRDKRLLLKITSDCTGAIGTIFFGNPERQSSSADFTTLRKSLLIGLRPYAGALPFSLIYFYFHRPGYFYYCRFCVRNLLLFPFRRHWTIEDFLFRVFVF